MTNDKSDHINRRAVMGAAGAASLILCSSANARADSKTRTADTLTSGKIFVLLHGAWHGGWCWRAVRALLEAKGHRVFTPTLTGLADRKHLLNLSVGLETHIQDIVAMIEYNDLNDIILVGHSYGGMVISGVADMLKDRIDHIIYLDAALPKDGDTMISQGPERDDTVLAATETALRALAPDGLAMQAFPPEILGIPKEHPRYNWVAKKLTPHPLKTWLDPIKLKNDGSKGLRRTYIHCTSPVLPNSSFAWHAAQIQKDASWQYHGLATGHDAMITAPKKLVGLFEKATAFKT